MVKRILIIAAIVIPMGFLIWFGIKAKEIWDKITFTPYVKEVDLKGRTLQDLLSSLGSLLGLSEQDLDIVTLGVEIKNDSNFTIPVKNFSMKLFYKDVEVASTSPELAEQKIIIQKNAVTQISDKIILSLNQASGELLAEGIAKKKPEIQYRISLSVYGIPIPASLLTGTFKWEY